MPSDEMKRDYSFQQPYSAPLPPPHPLGPPICIKYTHLEYEIEWLIFISANATDKSVGAPAPDTQISCI